MALRNPLSPRSLHSMNIPQSNALPANTPPATKPEGNPRIEHGCSTPPAQLNAIMTATSDQDTSAIQPDYTGSIPPLSLEDESVGGSDAGHQSSTGRGSFTIFEDLQTESPHPTSSQDIAELPPRQSLETTSDGPLIPPALSIESSSRNTNNNLVDDGTQLPECHGEQSASTEDLTERVNVQTHHNEDDGKTLCSEDTCFSDFSAVPNADMTTFSALRDQYVLETRLQERRSEAQLTEPVLFSTPATSKKTVDHSSAHLHHNLEKGDSSPTPKGAGRVQQDSDTTNLLLDFTQQFETFPQNREQSPSRQKVASAKRPASRPEPTLLSYMNSKRQASPQKAGLHTPNPRKSLLNLLDFDLPPQPTPRSRPTITIREVETLKSAHLSEISSLKASLNGRDAEVASLKHAVGDAEHRVGEALEQVREERISREHAERQQREWEEKGKELEIVLQTIREEYIQGEREKEQLQEDLDENIRQRKEAERRIERMSEWQSANAVSGPKESSGLDIDALVAQRVSQDTDEKMETLARELHAVYKKKHESKVVVLKKSYEARAEKKCSELQQEIDRLTHFSDELSKRQETKTEDDAVGVLAPIEKELPLQQVVQLQTDLQQHKTQTARLLEELRSVWQMNADILRDLESERSEKSELVAAVDEMLALQSETSILHSADQLGKSISRPSALKEPGFSGSRGASSGGLPRSISSGKSKMMNSIERMGGRSVQ